MSLQPSFPWHKSGADVDGPHRYRLWREWAPVLGRCVFIMLNPSTADDTQDDPTIRRCLRFATEWGYGRLDVVNLLAIRCTDPARLHTIDRDILVGARNDEAIREACADARMVLAAWGATAVKVGWPGTAVCLSALRAEQVLQVATRLSPVHCLGRTAAGHPRHPLYVAANTRPQVFRQRVQA